MQKEGSMANYLRFEPETFFLILALSWTTGMILDMSLDPAKLQLSHLYSPSDDYMGQCT